LLWIGADPDRRLFSTAAKKTLRSLSEASRASFVPSMLGPFLEGWDRVFGHVSLACTVLMISRLPVWRSIAVAN
jgi:hypothetical protein